MANLDSYTLSRSWFNWAFENPEKVHPAHTAIFFFAIEHCNRLGWKEKFGFPTQMAMDAIGIKKANTYIKYLNDLVEWGFVIMVEKSKNQYSANIISLQSAVPKNGKALDKASVRHGAKHVTGTGQSTGQSKVPIDKPYNNEPFLNNTNQCEEKNEEEEFYETGFYNIKISTKENFQLEKDVGPEAAKKCYEFLSDYKKEKNYKTKSDYLTIKRWVIDAVSKKQNSVNGSSKQSNHGQSAGAIKLIHSLAEDLKGFNAGGSSNAGG